MVNVVCAIIILEDRVLCVQRNEFMSLPLKWEFPGGKIEPGEIAPESLIREIKEELDIDIEVIMELHTRSHEYADRGMIIHLMPFICKYVSGNLNLLEHMDYKWLLPSELHTLDWAEADLYIVDLLQHKFGMIKQNIEFLAE